MFALKQPRYRLALLIVMILVGGVPMLATWLAFGAEVWWQFDRLTHFRAFYTAVLLPTTMLAMLFAAWRWALVWGLPLVLNLACIVPLYLPAADSDPMDQEPLSRMILTESERFARSVGDQADVQNPYDLPWQPPRDEQDDHDDKSAQPSAPPIGALKLMHINLLKSNDDITAVAEYVWQKRPHLLLLAEYRTGMRARLPHRLDDYMVLRHRARQDAFGIAAYAVKALPPGLEILDVDVTDVTRYVMDRPLGVPAIAIDLKYQGRALSLLTAHAFPPVSSRASAIRDLQLQGVSHWVVRHENPTLVIGDLNASTFSAAFRRLQRQTRLLNSQQGHGLTPTWPRYVPKVFRIAIDHGLHHRDLITVARQIGPSVGSDHLPLYWEVAWRDQGDPAIWLDPAPDAADPDDTARQDDPSDPDDTADRAHAPDPANPISQPRLADPPGDADPSDEDATDSAGPSVPSSRADPPSRPGSADRAGLEGTGGRL